MIEQIGTPREVYERAATPFVADFVGKTNVLKATCVGRGRYASASSELALPTRRHRDAASAVRLYLRPEDRARRTARWRRMPNARAAVVRRHRVPRHLLPAGSRRRLDGQPMLADFSLNQMDEFGVREAAESSSRCASTACGYSRGSLSSRSHERDRAAAPAAAPRRRRAREATGRARRAGAARRGACSCFLLAPLAMILIEQRRGQGRRVRRAREFRASTSQSRRCAVDLEHAGVRGADDAAHGPARVHVRLRDPAQLHPVQGLLRNIALVPILAPSLLAAMSFIYWFGNQGVLKAPGWVGATIYGAARHRALDGVRRLSRTR